LEGALESNARALLVAGSQQVRAKIRVRARVIGIELDRTLDELDRLIESVVACEVIPGHPVDLTVGWADLEDVLRALLEFGRLVVEPRDRGVERPRLEAVRIHCQRLLDAFARSITLTIVERELRLQQMRGHRIRIHLQRALEGGTRRRRIHPGIDLR